MGDSRLRSANCGKRHVVSGYATNGGLEVEHHSFVNEARDFSSEAGGSGRFVNDKGPATLRRRLGDGVDVERVQRPEIHNAGLDTPLLGEPVGRLKG